VIEALQFAQPFLALDALQQKLRAIMTGVGTGSIGILVDAPGPAGRLPSFDLLRRSMAPVTFQDAG
jgi:hypothetical protein